MHADVTGAFGFMVEELYFLETSMVFGSNTSTQLRAFQKGGSILDPHILDQD
jgi:hypothetical protein